MTLFNLSDFGHLKGVFLEIICLSFILLLSRILENGPTAQSL